MVDDNASKLVLDKFFDWAAATRGVPQWSVLGLLLFNVFVNDLHFNVTKAELNTYADDFKVLHFFENSLKANPDKFQSFGVAPARLSADFQF